MIFASNNSHKLEEVRRILYPLPVKSLGDIGFNNEIEETGETLEANSMIKTQAVVDWIEENSKELRGEWVIADDTGLEIAALNGDPGVYTARWAGEPANDARNRQKALTLLRNETDRRARFRTVITLMRGEEVYQMDGIVQGAIATEERGERGFGYDAIFIPEGYEKTFAELSEEIKNRISHRARALQALQTKLQEL